MYKLLNLIFGWDYIQWSNFSDRGIARVHLDGNGRIFYWRYKTTRVADEIKHAKQVLWLTCKPEKFGIN